MQRAGNPGPQKWLAAIVVVGALAAPVTVARADGDQPIPVAPTGGSTELGTFGVVMYGVALAMTAV